MITVSDKTDNTEGDSVEATMEDSVYKICNQLISNTHVIGIIIDCGFFPDVMPERFKQDKTINLCVISKESSNQKTMYMNDGYIINMHWHTQEDFTELIQQFPRNTEDKTILFDRTGFLKTLFEECSATY